MLTDMGHYRRFKLAKYRTNSARMLFAATLVTVLGLIVKNRVRVWRSSWLPLAKLLSLID
jgi:hypothetical protein